MNTLAIFLGAIGPGSWVIIGIAILLLFGGKKIPELMKGLGSGIKEFKNAAKDEEQKVTKKEDETTTKE
ncbi:MAG: twin-arginine translocase TatA/TatE family subunit [Flavobacterium sp.]|jgi:sec-independent protein translocase protein TatA